MSPDPDPPPSVPARLAPLLVGCVVLAALSLVIVPSTITFDPLTWATWAREIAHLRLDTRGGPAWKPLPVMVDVVFAPFGQGEKWAWLVVARAGALLAVAMAYRLARRLAGPIAGLIAAAGLALSSSYIEYLTPLGMSEPLMAGLFLLAIERHLDGKYPHAYGLLFACLLLRPETFPFFVGYSVFMWLRFPRSRPWIVILLALLPVLWLAPDYAGSGDWLRSTKRAAVPSQGGPLLTSFPAWAVVESAYNAVLLPIVVGAAVGVVLAVQEFRKQRRITTLATFSLLGVGWIVEEALVTQAHFGSGDQRYLIVGYGLLCVLAGVGWVRLAALVGGAPARVAAIAVIVAAAAPFVWQRADELTQTIGEIPYQAHKYGELETLIRQAGGRSRILVCGPVTSDIYQMPAIAWDLDIHQHQVVIGVRPSGTVFRTRTVRGSPLLPPELGSPDFHLVARTGQWQLLRTCPNG
ncbi:MAG TPA: hypothetical protein VHT75_06435 [Acidimicrobiales bacterium]|nr:hypothetical protein [Acidimicrobiales bacterium]